jgi:rSAM/selenodomain-associated transferase 2
MGHSRLDRSGCAIGARPAILTIMTVALDCPRISVIIPVLDDAEPLQQLLNQLGGLITDRAEVVVVDGGSSDLSAMIAGSHSVVLVHSERSRARQLNAGIAAAKAPVIWMLHADCEVSPDVWRCMEWMAGDESIRWGRFDVALSGRHWMLRWVERMMNLRSRATSICTGDQGIFVRRRVLDAVGGVPEQPLMEDIELSRRLRRLGRSYCARETLGASSRKWEAEGIGSTIVLMWRLRLAYFFGADPRQLAERYYGS